MHNICDSFLKLWQKTGGDSLKGGIINFKLTVPDMSEHCGGEEMRRKRSSRGSQEAERALH